MTFIHETNWTNYATLNRQHEIMDIENEYEVNMKHLALHRYMNVICET